MIKLTVGRVAPNHPSDLVTPNKPGNNRCLSLAHPPGGAQGGQTAHLRTGPATFGYRQGRPFRGSIHGRPGLRNAARRDTRAPLEDVDFETRTIRVKQALQRSGGRNVDGEGQRSKLHFVAPELSRRENDRNAGLRGYGVAVTSSKTIRTASGGRQGMAGSWTRFRDSKGAPVEPRRLDEQFKRLLAKADLPSSIRLHDSRHFAASLLLAQGTHPRTVMEILGHSDISLTMNTYSHVVPEVMREAAEKIDAVLGGK